MKQHIVCVLRRMLFVGVSIQIVLGMVWLVTNFTGIQEFGDTYLYIEAGRTLVCDEYIGIIYPLLIRIVKGIEAVIGIPWYYFLYLLQLSAGIGAAYFMVTTLTEKAGKRLSLFWRIWGALGIISLPAAMQCHLAVLPNSLVCSLYMIMIVLGVRIIQEPENSAAKEIAKMGILWLLISLLMPEYRLLGGILLLAVIVWRLVLTKGRCKARTGIYSLLLFAAFGGMVVSISTMTQTTGALGRPMDSVALRAVSRFVWPNFQDNHGAWPGEITDVMEWETAEEISRTADGVYTVFAPMMEEALGAENVQEVYWKLVKTVFGIRSRDIAEKILWDGACHVFAPYMLTKQLEGAGYQSYSGRNYEIMKAQTPGITKLYISYEGWWFVIGIGLTVLFEILTFKKGAASLERGKLLLVLNALIMVIYFTMRGAGIMDYKLTVFMTVLWMLWICKPAMDCFQKDIDN